MANLTEVSQWESVIRQIENGEAATGGADGLANIQAKQLANRTKWLKDNYLPLAGGEFNEGDIYISKKGNDGRLVLTGGNSPSGSIELFGSENMVAQGKTILRARDGSVDSALHIYPDGSLTHQATKGGSHYDLAGSAIVAKSLESNGYIKYASGLIIQWGYINSHNLQAMNSYFYVDVPLNISFSDVGYQAFSNFSIAPNNLGPFPITVCLPRGKNKITISTDFKNEYSFQINWLAIGI